MADRIVDEKTSAFVVLVANHATEVSVDGLRGTDSEGRTSTGSMSASPKRALVSGAGEGAIRYFVFDEVGECFSARCSFPMFLIQPHGI